MAAVFLQKDCEGEKKVLRMLSFPSIYSDTSLIQPASKYALEKQAAVDIKTYLLKVTRNDAAAATVLNMPQGKEIMYDEIIALIVAMMTNDIQFISVEYKNISVRKK